MELKPEHLAFLKANEHHFATAKDGWVSNVEGLDMLEHIYHQYLDSRFILTKWCKDCVFNMILRLAHLYELNKQNENISTRKPKLRR
jgi:hypothetical protein